MAAIVNMFGWKKVITVSTREPYGNDGVQAFNNVSNSVYGTEVSLLLFVLYVVSTFEK